MKTRFKVLLSLLLLLALPAAVQAQFNFTTNNGAITITGYTGSGGEVNIPDAMNIGGLNLPVTSIGGNAFTSCATLASIKIPNSVTNIGYGAFYDCTNLTNVTIGNGVTSIGYEAFMGSSLTSVTIPNSVTSIGRFAFLECESLSAIAVDTNNPAYSGLDGVLFDKTQTTLMLCPEGRAGYTVPESVTSIAGLAFYGCTNLTSVTIPNSVKSIGDGAFEDCSSLTSVTIPNSITNVGSATFLGCTSLTNVMIGKSVTQIGNATFFLCTSLSAITVDALNTSYSSVDGVLLDPNRTTLITCPGGKAGNYTIPNGVISIAGVAFYCCTNLTSVTIPTSVTNIGPDAFESCYGLTSIIIPNSVTYIGSQAFYDSTRLTSVYFQGNAPGADSSVFSYDNNATVYYLSGTTGWYSPFGGVPAVLWNPRVQTSGASFGVRTNRFGFNITGTKNLVIVVEACTNLANHTWSPVSTNILRGGSSYFSDPQWTNYPARFYRLCSP